MAFDRDLVEAHLALGHVGTPDMPKLAWDALEAGLDGPATRRLAALRSPTFFEVRGVLPTVLQEWGMKQLSPEDAALRLAKFRVRQILQNDEDPLEHAGDFYQMWVDADYCSSLCEYGPLGDEAFVARECGQSDDEIRAWLLEKFKALAAL